MGHVIPASFEDFILEVAIKHTCLSFNGTELAMPFRVIDVRQHLT